MNWQDRPTLARMAIPHQTDPGGAGKKIKLRFDENVIIYKA